MNSSPLDKFLHQSTSIFSERYPFHLQHADVPLQEHIRNRHEEIFEKISSKKVVYLDTNAWKCISDYMRGKTKLTPHMTAFAKLATSAEVLARCIFPMGLATIFELQSMTDPLTTSTLIRIVDELSQNICIRPSPDVIGDQLVQFRDRRAVQPIPRRENFCWSFELFWLQSAELPEYLGDYEIDAFKKALFDLCVELPVSVQLELAGDIKSRWDSGEGIEDMNARKAAGAGRINSMNEAIFDELCGTLFNFLPNEPGPSGRSLLKDVALMSMIHWNENPESLHMYSARVSSNLHALRACLRSLQ